MSQPENSVHMDEIQLMEAYFSGELSREEVREVEARVLTDPAFRRKFETMEALFGLAAKRKAAAPEASVSFKPKGCRSYFQKRHFMSLVAGLALLAVLGLVAFDDLPRLVAERMSFHVQSYKSFGPQLIHIATHGAVVSGTWVKEQEEKADTVWLPGVRIRED